MSNGKKHNRPTEIFPVFLDEYRGNQEAINGRLDSIITILQSLKCSSYQSKA